MRFFLTLSAAVYAVVVATFATIAHEYQAGALLIEHPVIPSTVRSAPVAAGYLKITNSGNEPERLNSVRTEISVKSSIHEMKMVDGVMKMRPITGGLEIPAGATITLKKGGNHLMFMKLHEQMETGQSHKVVLTFEKAGDVEVEMLVVDPADLGDGDEKEDGSSHSEHTH